jgi:hypothetical protein
MTADYVYKGLIKRCLQLNYKIERIHETFEKNAFWKVAFGKKTRTPSTNFYFLIRGKGAKQDNYLASDFY